MPTAERNAELFKAGIKEELQGILKQAKKRGCGLGGVSDVVYERLADKYGVDGSLIHSLKSEVWKSI